MRVYGLTLGDRFSRDEPVAHFTGSAVVVDGEGAPAVNCNRLRARTRVRASGWFIVWPGDGDANALRSPQALADEAAGGAGTRKKRRRCGSSVSSPRGRSVGVSSNDADPATTAQGGGRDVNSSASPLEPPLSSKAVWITVDCEGAGGALWLLAGDPVVVDVEPLVERHRAEVEGGASPKVRHRPTHHHAGRVVSAHLPDAVRIPGVQLSAVLIRRRNPGVCRTGRECQRG